MTCIATFYSHFGAIRFKRTCNSLGWSAQVMPVPRNLSSSCGTCVRYEGECPASPPQEIEQIVQVTEQGYIQLYRAKDA